MAPFSLAAFLKFLVGIFLLQGATALLLMDAGMAFYTLNAVAPLLGIGPIASFAQAINPFPLVGLLLSKASAR